MLTTGLFGYWIDFRFFFLISCLINTMKQQEIFLCIDPAQFYAKPQSHCSETDLSNFFFVLSLSLSLFRAVDKQRNKKNQLLFHTADTFVIKGSDFRSVHFIKITFTHLLHYKVECVRKKKKIFHFHHRFCSIHRYSVLVAFAFG